MRLYGFLSIALKQGKRRPKGKRRARRPHARSPRGGRRCRKRSTLGGALLLSCLLAATACRQSLEAPTAQATPLVEDALKAAVQGVEEARGAPTGRKVELAVPAQLRHYADRRRFLAIQQASWREWHYEIPQDYVELLEGIEKGGFVEMLPLGDAYLLYGAGENATTARFTHYDAALKQSVPLFADDEEVREERRRLTDTINRAEADKVDVQLLLSRTPAGAARRTLIAQLAELENRSKTVTEERQLLDFFYQDAVRRLLLFARFRWLQEIAANFRGKAYNLASPAERRQFKMRLLAFTRPQTRDIIIEIADAYKERFGRHLPITSLFRTREYQRQLREVNPNAARVEAPPHTTGLAFDIYDRYMSAEEQSFLLSRIAAMEAAGRVEALRENRDHIHVFAFPAGRPPGEKHVTSALR